MVAACKPPLLPEWFGLPVIVLAVLTLAPFFVVLERRPARLYRVIYVMAFAITACILAFEPVYTIIQTARYHTWIRSSYLGYPEVIDELKPGSSILNLGEETLNFRLAGSHLTNRVIPNWERPPTLTADFLRSGHIEFIAEKSAHQASGAAGAPLEGLDLYFSGVLGKDAGAADWRIWSTRQLRQHSDTP